MASWKQRTRRRHWCQIRARWWLPLRQLPSCQLQHRPKVAVDNSEQGRNTWRAGQFYIRTTGLLIRTPPRRLTPEKLKIAQQFFQLMCADGICRRSSSPWSSRLHMVPKKDKTWWPCSDFRCLNQATVRDLYPIPHLQDFSSCLAGSIIFSKIDLVMGYHQIPVWEEDIPKMAIATPFGLYEFILMPFGLKNAAQTFQRMVNKVTQHLPDVFVYLDNVLVASSSLAQHASHLWQLFKSLQWFGLVINEAKCMFGMRELDFFKHRVTSAGIKPLVENEHAVRQYKALRTVKALQRLLGMLNFYGWFLPKIAEVPRPLTDALAGVPKHLSWTAPMMSAFEEAKSRFAQATLLNHPLPNAQLHLPTDASERAIAGMIHQLVDGQEQPLAYYSRRMTAAKSRYSAYDLELLVMYSLILHFRHVLEGREFKIFTDQKLLMRAFLKARNPISSRQQHQLAFISEFCRDIAHVPGMDNVVADALSPQHNDDGKNDGDSHKDNMAIVHVVAHLMTDIDLNQLAAEQPEPLVMGPPNLFYLRHLWVPGCSRKIWCDTLQGWIRLLVPPDLERKSSPWYTTSTTRQAGPRWQ